MCIDYMTNGCTKAVSERFISAAIFCIRSSDSGSLAVSRMHTPAGFPEKGEQENESTVKTSILKFSTRRGGQGPTHDTIDRLHKVTSHTSKL